MANKPDPYEKVFRDIGFDTKQFTDTALLQFSGTYTPEGNSQPKHAGTLLKKLTYYNPKTGFQFNNEGVNLFTQAFTYTVLRDIYAKGSTYSLTKMNLQYVASYMKHRDKIGQSNHVCQEFAKEIYKITQHHMTELSMDTKTLIDSAVQVTKTHAELLIHNYVKRVDNTSERDKNISLLAKYLIQLIDINRLLGTTTLTTCMECHRYMTDIPGIGDCNILALLIPYMGTYQFETVYTVPTTNTHKLDKTQDLLMQHAIKTADHSNHTGVYTALVTSLQSMFAATKLLNDEHNALKASYKQAIDVLRTLPTPQPLVEAYDTNPRFRSASHQADTSKTADHSAESRWTAILRKHGLKDLWEAFGYPY